MYSAHNNHPEGLNMLLTSQIFPGRPVMGSWITYALGTENQSLPAYVVLRAPEGYSVSGKILWSSGWLPAVYQGTELSTSGSPFPNMTPTRSRPAQAQQRHLSLLNEFNHQHREQHPHNTELEARIENFEFRAAAQSLMKGCDALNTFFDDQAPWKLTKGDASDLALCGEVVERCLAYLELLSRRMSPFCPDSATSLRTMLGEAAAGSGKDWGGEGSGHPPARVATGAILGEAGVLFRKIENDAIQEEISRLEGAVS